MKTCVIHMIKIVDSFFCIQLLGKFVENGVYRFSKKALKSTLNKSERAINSETRIL